MPGFPYPGPGCSDLIQSEREGYDMTITRRQAMKTTVLAVAALAASPWAMGQTSSSALLAAGDGDSSSLGQAELARQILADPTLREVLRMTFFKFQGPDGDSVDGYTTLDPAKVKTAYGAICVERAFRPRARFGLGSDQGRLGRCSI